MPTDLEGLWEKLEEASAPEMGGLDAWFPPACEPIITQWVTEHDTELAAEIGQMQDTINEDRSTIEGIVDELCQALGWEEIDGEEDLEFLIRRAVKSLAGQRDSLRAQLSEAAAAHEAELTQALEERDLFHEWADKLAYAIAPEPVIGEHSSLNNPWRNAVEIANQGEQ